MKGSTQYEISHDSSTQITFHSIGLGSTRNFERFKDSEREENAIVDRVWNVMQWEL
jgi:hypothetical protein